MAIDLDSLSTGNGFPANFTHSDKVFYFGQSLGFPDMSDDDIIFLLLEGCKWEKERKGLMHINPYLDRNQVLDKLAEHGR